MHGKIIGKFTRWDWHMIVHECATTEFIMDRGGKAVQSLRRRKYLGVSSAMGSDAALVSN